MGNIVINMVKKCKCSADLVLSIQTKKCCVSLASIFNTQRQLQLDVKRNALKIIYENADALL